MKDCEFKVGDWIQHPDGYVFMFLFEHKKDLPFIGDFKLWKPKVGEWCVFWEHSSSYHIERLQSFTMNICNVAPLEFIQTLIDERKEQL